MPVYPESIAELIRSPKYVGKIERPNAVGTDARLDCGCFIRFELSISDVSPAIEEIGYRTNGCGYMTAAAEDLAGSVIGRPMTELGANFDPRLARGPDREACVSASINALKAAFADHRARKVEEFSGEKALICTCFGIAEETVEQFVRATRPADVSDVTSELRAGGGCGSCRMLIQEIIDAND